MNIGRAFKNGLLAIIPTSLSIYAIYWVCTTAEGLLAGPIRNWLNTHDQSLKYFPGLGMAVGILVVFLVGLVLDFWVARILWRRVEGMVARIPLLKTIYGSLKDLTTFFAGDSRRNRPQRVVLVRVFDHGKLMGLVTRETFEGLTSGMANEGEVAVFIPFSYAMGGYTMLVPRERVETTGLSVEQGLRFAATAWMVSPEASPFREPDDRTGGKDK